MHRPEVSKYVGTRLYNIYNNMIMRCTNKKAINYSRYGGRGITVCEQWLKRGGNLDFFKWAENNGYEENLSLDRIDNDKGYSPENCRWTDLRTQGKNKRNNIYLTFNGKTQILEEWSRETGIDSRLLRYRTTHGWSDEEALTIPPETKRTRKPKRRND